MMPTREDILHTLAEEHKKLLARYQAFTPEELDTPCTESEDPNGAPWRPKDHLAHLTLIEQSFQKMIKRTLKGYEDPVGFSRIGARDRGEVLAWIHHQNQDYVDAHRDDDMTTRLANLEQARQETLSLLAQLTDEQLKEPITGAPWNDGTIGGVLITNAHHEGQHLNWIEQGLHAHGVQ
jgi:hypothetical protein